MGTGRLVFIFTCLLWTSVATETAGDSGRLMAGDSGRLTSHTAGDPGKLTAGDSGRLTAGDSGRLTAGDSGRCPDTCFCRQEDNTTETSNQNVTCTSYSYDKIPEIRGSVHTLIFSDGASIKTLQDDAFTHLTSLKDLLITSVSPWSMEPQAFRGLSSLESLTLSAPLPPNTLPSVIFSPLISLKHLKMKLDLQDIPSDPICQTTSLQSLDLSSNQLLNTSSFGLCFSAMVNLSTVDLSHNNLSSLSDVLLRALGNSSITELLLNDNKLASLSSDSFKSLPFLETVDLRRNFIQKLPHALFRGNKNIKTLYLAMNDLTAIPCQALEGLVKLETLGLGQQPKMRELNFCNVFYNLTSLTTLNLMQTGVQSAQSETFHPLKYSKITHLLLTIRKTIPADIFENFRLLKRLRCSGCHSQQLRGTFKSLAKTNIEQLRIDSLVSPKLSVLKNDYFTDLKDTKLKELSLNTCNISTIEPEAFHFLNDLEVLSLRHNAIISLPNQLFKGLTKLRSLNLGNNKITEMSLRLQDWGVNHKYLQRLYLQGNHLFYATMRTLFSDYRNIIVLDLSNNNMQRIKHANFRNTSVKTLKLNNNNIKEMDGTEFEHLTSLEELEINNLGEKFKFDKKCKKNPFKHQVMLKSLSMSGITITEDFPFLGEMFANHPKLEQLIIPSNTIHNLTVGMFDNTTSLQTLDLSGNDIHEWQPEVFEPLGKSLKSLSLKKNKIAHVTSTSFLHLDVLLQLDLSENVLSCTCDLLWFHQWTLQAEVNLKDMGSYQCAGQNKWAGKPLLDFTTGQSMDDCIDHTLFIISVSLSVCGVLVIILAYVGHKYRYHIYYAMFYIRTRRQRLLDDVDATDYQFDAFVAYASDDLTWVINKLLPALEIKGQFKLCIHHRDWVPGVDITENIVESIETSRKVILVLSDKFARSQWCQVETNMAHMLRMGSRRSGVIMISLSEIKPANLTPMLRALMSEQTYLPWPDAEKEQGRFWRRLRSALKHKPRRGRGREAQEEDDREEEMVPFITEEEDQSTYHTIQNLT